LDSGNPDGTSQTLEATAYTPVNAVGIYLSMSNQDSDNDNLKVQIQVYGGYELIGGNGWKKYAAYGWLHFERGASRDLLWMGYDNDDNYFTIYLYGYQIER
jgi:hypothetical protein